jgi:hypothetical protein
MRKLPVTRSGKRAGGRRGRYSLGATRRRRVELDLCADAVDLDLAYSRECRPEKGPRQAGCVEACRESNRPLGFRALLRRSSQIAAYPRAFFSARLDARMGKPLEICNIRRRRLLETCLIAMPKLEGSNPISRFNGSSPIASTWGAARAQRLTRFVANGRRLAAAPRESAAVARAPPGARSSTALATCCCEAASG